MTTVKVSSSKVVLNQLGWVSPFASSDHHYKQPAQGP
jgi:hypothetical protein